jgi:hypothetical protein
LRYWQQVMKTKGKVLAGPSQILGVCVLTQPTAAGYPWRTIARFRFTGQEYVNKGNCTDQVVFWMKKHKIRYFLRRQKAN